MSKEMAIIAKAIPNIAFNADIPVGAFRYNNWRVVMDKREIHVKDIEREADAVEVIDYLKNIIEMASERQEQ
jgi:hypothetical protein